MSRTTQYIGLTNAANSWLKINALQETSKNFVMCYGMFDEDVLGVECDIKPLYNDNKINPVNKRYFVREVEQDSPWSSGPMIFTRLELFIEKTSGQIISLGYIFDWVKNPEVTNEYDSEKGEYWV
jgi:hypothetical protein